MGVTHRLCLSSFRCLASLKQLYTFYLVGSSETYFWSHCLAPIGSLNREAKDGMDIQMKLILLLWKNTLKPSLDSEERQENS